VGYVVVVMVGVVVVGGPDNAIAFLVQFNIIRYNKKQKDKTQGIHRPQQRSDGFQKTGIDETHARAPP